MLDWEQVEYLVDQQVGYWRAVGKVNWAEALERCLARARRSRTMQDVAFNLRQWLNEAEDTQQRSNDDAHRSSNRPGIN